MNTVFATYLCKILNRITLSHILIFGFLLRLLALIAFPHIFLNDAHTYQLEGNLIVNHSTMRSDHCMPLYPLIAYFSGGEWKQSLLDIAFSTASIYLLYHLSYILFQKKTAALLAALMLAIYPYSIFYSIVKITESVFVFLLLLSYFWLYKKRYFLACIALSLLVLMRPSTDLLNPLLIATFVLVIHHESWKKAIGWVLAYIMIYAALLSPWWVFNYHRYHQFVRLSPATGLMLYVGNNPLNQTGGGIHGKDANIRQFQHLDSITRDRMMTQLAIDYIKQNPWHIVKLDVKKFLRFWQPWPYAEKFKNSYTVLVSLFSYGIILMLNIIFIFKTLKKKWSLLSPILLLILYLTAVHTVTISSIRYRYPLEPFMIIFAAYTLSEFFSAFGNIGCKRSNCK